MRFGVIGCGSIARRHIANLLAMGHEVAACNRGAEKRNLVADQFGVPVFETPELMFADWRADAALVATSTTRHAQDALLAARNGLHLFIEKPLSHNLEGIDFLADEVAKRGLIVHVGCNMRFHFGPRLVHETLRSQRLGRPLWSQLWGRMHLPDWHPYEDHRIGTSAKAEFGGGAVLDFIHEIDLALWLFGAEPDFVIGSVANTGWLEIETEELADFILGYDQGLQVSVHVDYLQKPVARGIRVLGEKGWIAWELEHNHVLIHDYATGETERRVPPDDYEKNSMYLDQMAYFTGCLESKTPSDSGLAEGLAALKVALMVKQSSNTRSMCSSVCA